MTKSWRSIELAMLLLSFSLLGCSNLDVKKVPVQQRVAGTDDQQGFRYFLNRPYLVVKKPIPLYEKKTLVNLQDPALKDFLRRVAQRSADGIESVQPKEIEKAIEALSLQNGIALPQGGGTGAAASAGEELTNGGARATAAAAESAGSLDMPQIKDLPEDTKLEGDVQIIYLPDLDEQYVIKSKNWVAKSAFALAFKNGSELVEVNGEHDATTVTLALFKQIQEAIGVAQSVAQEQIKQAAKSGESGGGGSGGAKARTAAEDAVRGNDPVYQMVERVYIKPGVYRLNKPWEMEGAQCEVGTGLLAKMGLPTATDIQFNRIGAVDNAPEKTSNVAAPRHVGVYPSQEPIQPEELPALP